MERLSYKNMVNIIPMAGLGSRFSKEGYLLPKPLIPVSGKPMIIHSIRQMPKADKWIFIVRKEHVEEYSINKIIQAEIKDAIIIEIEETTEGQASTCMLAMSHVDDNDEVFVAACDNSFLFNEKKFNELREREDVDAVVWTFTQDTLLADNPQAWGWIKVAEDGEIVEDVSVKIPVSETPFKDHAVVATFYFKRAGDFKDAYNAMYAENYRINNEFYVDSIPIFMNKLGKKSVIFDVDLYVGWGKPGDLYQYQLKEFEYQLKKVKHEISDGPWDNFFALIEKNGK